MHSFGVMGQQPPTTFGFLAIVVVVAMESKRAGCATLPLLHDGRRDNSESTSPCAVATTQVGGVETAVFCAAEGLCEAVSGDGSVSGASTCDVVDHIAYVQRAIYWVSGRDDSGHKDNGSSGGRRGGTVHLSSGQHTLGAVLDAWCVVYIVRRHSAS